MCTTAYALDCIVKDLNIKCKPETTKIFITPNRQNGTFVKLVSIKQ